ncbi:TetR/AcrR family transcriptional regulator [Ruminococcaceae bacterium OttesenSCG-928-A16]|nr:TetR/AcrR family transcriptional regulator [Ruminococcaceae bacterium OttesenSCG-928-A16]
MASTTTADSLLKAKPKTKKGEETLARLCQAAEELFAEKSYYSASVSEIVMRAGISIGGFYIYFTDKLSLYKYMVLQYGRKLRKYIAVQLAGMELDSRRAMEREGMKLFFDFCIENPAIFSIVWQSLFVAPELFIDYYDDFGKQYEKRLGDAVRTGEVRPVNLEVASYVLMGASNFLAHKYITFGPPTPLNDERLYRVVDDMMDIFDKGLFIEKPDTKK